MGRILMLVGFDSVEMPFQSQKIKNSILVQKHMENLENITTENSEILPTWISQIPETSPNQTCP